MSSPVVKTPFSSRNWRTKPKPVTNKLLLSVALTTAAIPARLLWQLNTSDHNFGSHHAMGSSHCSSSTEYHATQTTPCIGL